MGRFKNIYKHEEQSQKSGIGPGTGDSTNKLSATGAAASGSADQTRQPG
jgi:hypothetical protein